MPSVSPYLAISLVRRTRSFGFEFCFLGSLRGYSFLFRFVQFGNRHKYRKLRQPVLGGLVAGSDEDFGIKMRIGIIGNLA